MIEETRPDHQLENPPRRQVGGSELPVSVLQIVLQHSVPLVQMLPIA